MKGGLLAPVVPGVPAASFQPHEHSGNGWPGGGATSLSAAQVGLWTFMAVVCALFALFAVAYVMRIGYGDWRPPPPVPWQLWLSTILLCGASLAWQVAARLARRGRRAALHWCVAGWLASLAFVASQLGGWAAMAAQGWLPAGTPGAAFFYMLTGLHGVHVLGGMAAAAIVTPRLARPGSTPARRSLGTRLCAQYWHLLLALWLALFALLFTVTPELVRDVCGTLGIPVR